MSTEQLRRELARVAEGAPGVEVSPDTWRRARRAVVRDRVAATAAVAAAVAVVALAITWVPRHHTPPVADTAPGAIPSHLWTLPSDITVPTEHDLAVGPVAAAYLSDDDQTGKARFVVVTAADGAYHLLPLSGPGGEAVPKSEPGLGFHPFQLSPDGRELAYSYSPSTGPYSEVAVLDLVEGSVRLVPLTIGNGVLLKEFTWSLDGSWLLWSGQEVTRPGHYGDSLSGLIAPGATTSTPLPAEPQDDGPRGYAVDDDGTVALIDPDRIQTWRAGTVVGEQPVTLGSTYSASALLTDGQVIELRYPLTSDDASGDERVLLARHGNTACGGRTCGPTQVSGPVPRSLSSVSSLGWTSQGVLLVENDPPARSSAEAAIYRLEVDDRGRVTAHRWVGLDSHLRLSGLTLASALPVADRPAPSWARHDRAWPAIGLGVAGALVLLVGGLWWSRRRYRAAR